MTLLKEEISELESIENNKGQITPDVLLETARSEDSSLHNKFTWDDSEAAEKWRLEEARYLIKSFRLVVTIEEREIKVPMYVRDPSKDDSEQGYISILRIKERTSAEVLKAELDCVLALLNRTLGIAEMKKDVLPANVVSEIKKIIGRTSELMNNL